MRFIEYKCRDKTRLRKHAFIIQSANTQSQQRWRSPCDRQTDREQSPASVVSAICSASQQGDAWLIRHPVHQAEIPITQSISTVDVCPAWRATWRHSIKPVFVLQRSPFWSISGQSPAYDCRPPSSFAFESLPFNIKTLVLPMPDKRGRLKLKFWGNLAPSCIFIIPVPRCPLVIKCSLKNLGGGQNLGVCGPVPRRKPRTAHADEGGSTRPAVCAASYKIHAKV